MIKSIDLLFFTLVAVSVLVGKCMVGEAVAQGGPDSLPPESSDSSKPVGYLNWPLKTAGGMQFWTDWRSEGGWRIQQNSETGHCRLIDDRQVRRAWGNFAHCDQTLAAFIADQKVQPTKGKVVVLLHGLVRTSRSMSTLAKHLAIRGYATVNFQYASSRRGTREHALALKSVIDGLNPEVTDIFLVGHSLGNIVIRRYLNDATDPTTGVQGDSRIRRIVMIGPPNQGSAMARTFQNNPAFQVFAGASGQELAGGWVNLATHLATPKVPFGIIAGGQSQDTVSNPIVHGKDDFTVSVDETRLAGASDFLVHPLVHGTMMNQPIVLQATTRFFQYGYFRSADRRTPLAADPARKN